MMIILNSGGIKHLNMETQRSLKLFEKNTFMAKTPHYGLAVSMGTLVLFSVWETPKTEVVVPSRGESS
jgi:hypothetical protein